MNQKNFYEELFQTLLKTETILLQPITSEHQVKQALQIIGEYLRADRVYIMKINRDFIASNIYEWHSDTCSSLMEKRQKMDLRKFPYWHQAFKMNIQFVISNTEDLMNRPEWKNECEMLRNHGIHSMEAYPIRNVNDDIVGFFAVDNPILTEENEVLLQMVAMSLTYTFETMNSIREKDFERKQLEEALIKNCSDVFSINVETGEYKALKQTEKSIGEIPASGNADESISRYILKYVTDDRKEAILRMLKLENLVNRLKSENGYFKMDYRRITEGEPEWYRTEVIASRYDEGRPIRLIACFHEIQEEKDREEYHLRNSNMIETIAEQYDYLYYVNVERDEYKVIRSIGNKDVMEAGVIGLSELITYYVNYCVLPEDRDKVRTYLTDDKYQIVRKGGYISEFEYRRIDRNGDYHWYRMQILPISGAGKHRGEALVGIHDIHGKKKEELEQREVISSLSEEYFSIYLVSLKTGACKVIRSVESFGEKTGDEANYRYLVEFFRDQVVSEEFVEDLNDIIDLDSLGKHFKKSRRKIEKTCRSKRGRWFTVHIMCTELFELTGEIIVAVRNSDAMMLQKLALQDALEASRKANETKTEFMSKISHELKTPLNAVIGMNAIATAYIDDGDRVRKCLTQMNESSNELLLLINEVLSMSKVEAGRMVLNETDMDLYLFMEAFIQKNTENAASRQITILLSESLVNSKVCGDFEKIEEALTGIMNIAFKYSNAGDTINITIREQTTGLRNTGSYEFSFKNRNVYFSPATLKNVYEPLQSGNSDEVGFGFGLALVRNTLNMMNGSIDTCSTESEGSEIKVSIYLKYSEEKKCAENVAVSAKKAERKEADFTGKNILIVDDKEINLEIMKELLKLFHIESDGVKNGVEAVQKFSQSPENHYHLILMDIRMPLMDGYQASYAIRNLDREDARKVPIIAVSANNFADDIRKGRDAGMNDYLPKPVNKENILLLLNKYILE